MKDIRVTVFYMKNMSCVVVSMNLHMLWTMIECVVLYLLQLNDTVCLLCYVLRLLRVCSVNMPLAYSLYSYTYSPCQICNP